MKNNDTIKLSNISRKLIGIPKIIYQNYDDNEVNKQYMEDQFNWWGITNYKRYSKKYSKSNYDEWKHLILNRDELAQTPEEFALTLNVIDSIVEWYDSEEDDMCIFMEDTIDFDVINKWFFDWNFLNEHLPYNWDCIQMFSSAPRRIKMYLSPWESDNGSCYCFMITRYLAKKIKHYHKKGEYFILHYSTPNKSIPNFEYGSLHRFFYDLGITYTLPIFYLNSQFLKNDTHNDLMDKLSSEAIKYWWDARSKLYSSFEFFHYNKADEWKMEVMFDISTKQPYIFKDKKETLPIWI